MRTIWLVMALAAAGCSGTDKAPAPAPHGATPAAPSECEAARGKIEALYRTEAQQKEPKRVDQAVADNTQMALADCAKEPKRAGCMAGATSAAQLEKDCLIALDPEGTEGDQR